MLSAGRPIAVGVRPHVGLDLRERALRLLERKLVLAGVDRPDELVPAHLELGPTHLVAGVHQRYLVVGRLHARVGIQLHQLLFGFLQLGPRLIEVVLLLGGIERQHHRPIRYNCAGRQQLDDLQHPRRRRRGQDERAARSELAQRVHPDVEVAVFGASGGDALGRRPQVGQPEDDGGAGRADDQNGQEHANQPHGRAPPASRAGSSSATRSPGSAPRLMTA